MTALVFENTQGQLESLNGLTVGVVRLDLDDPDTDLLASMQYLSEITAWEAGTERQTTTLTYTLEPVTDTRNAGVVRYTTTPPTFDEAVSNVNAVAFHSTAGGTDATNELLFVLMLEDTPGFTGWTPNEPLDGLARVRVDATLGQLALGDLTNTDTAGAAAGDSLVFDGSTWVPGPGGRPDLLNPLTASGAPSNAGPGSLLGFGADSTGYTGGEAAAETIPAGGWDGLKVMGQMRSTVGSSFPVAGFSFTAEVYISRRTYAAAGEWIEIVTVHSYTLGDFNELHDWLEIAAVQDDPDAADMPVGIDLRLNGETIEYTFKTTGRPLRFNTWQLLEVEQDPATAEITVTVDGGTPESGVPARVDDPMDTPTTPCTLSTPDSGADILVARGAVVVGEMTLVEYGDPPAALIDPADGTDGAQSFTSGGRSWETWSGRVSGPLRSRSLLIGPWSNTSDSFDIAAGDSFTWLLTGARLATWDYSIASGSVIHWGRNPASLSPFGPGGVGWAFLSVPGFGVDVGFGITSAGFAGSVTATGTRPPGPCTLAAVLNRDDDTLRLYICTADAGTVLASEVDAAAVGAVAPSASTDLFGGVGGELAGHALTFRRALTPAEITYLALSAP